jgi:hypothetical protein
MKTRARHICIPVPGEFGRYQVESASAPGEHYYVDVISGECPCRGWEIRKHCSHLDDSKDEHEKRKQQYQRGLKRRVRK